MTPTSMPGTLSTMALVAQELHRLQALRGELVNKADALDLVGVNPFDSELEGRLLAFAMQRRSRTPALQGGQVSRHLLESFLQEHGLLSARSAALRLGMTATSFEATLAALEDRGLLLPGDVWPNGLVRVELVDRLPLRIPDVAQAPVFSSQTSYSNWVHEQLRDRLGVQIERCPCATSVRLGETPPDLAFDLCCISHEPVSLKYRVYMNFGKPLRLPPDVCALHILARNLDALRPFVLGSMPDLLGLDAA